MADMERIMDIASSYNLKVVEDATEALGTRYVTGRYAGKFAGTIGDFGAYSFNGNKIITTGGGGMVVASNQDELNHIAYVSTQCKDDPLFYIHNEVGYNYRMTNVQASIGVAQMETLEEFIDRKNNNYDKYCSLFVGNDNVTMMPFRKGTKSNKWFYALKVNKKDTDMHALVHKLSELGVQTRLIWGLISEQKPYEDSIAYSIEKAKEYSKCILNIPCSTNLKEEEISIVCDKLNGLLRS
jgi:perosamine synthetase